MSAEHVEVRPPLDGLGLRGYHIILAWALFVALVYAVGGYFGVRALWRYKAETTESRAAFLGSAAATRAPAPVPRGRAVDVGLYINHISDVSVRDGVWTADFDIWFHWRGSDIAPGETFQLVNGELVRREKVDEQTDGDQRYARYAVSAKLKAAFDTARFPLGDDVVTIQIEDRAHADALHYVASSRASGVSRTALPRNRAIKKWAATVKHDVADSNLGDPRYSAATPPVRSRYFFAMVANPAGWPLFLKDFQALFASVAIALIAFFIKPTWGDGRFGMGVGAAFAAIANNVAVGSTIPPTDRFTLIAMINGVGLATIILTLVASTASLYILDGLERPGLSSLFDKVSFVLCTAGYVCLTLWLPIAAAA